MSKQQFKVGDRVRVTGDTEDRLGHGLHVGYVGEITAVSTKLHYIIDGWFVGPNDVEDASVAPTLPTDSQERKSIPLCTGVLDYFPAALAYVAKISKYGNDKHNPGEPLHWARGKSMDHADCVGRHLVERGTVDPESGLLHSGYLAWRALALLQEELEQAGAPMSRGSKTV